MEINPERLKSLALSRKNAFKKKKAALSKLKDSALDRLVHDAHTEAFKEVDCLQCANCCKTAGPRLRDSDVIRMASYLRINPAKLHEKYLKIDEDGDLVMNSLPCPFLGHDNYCSIYEARPKACREYPHTDRKKQKQLLNLHVKNSEYCPAVFRIFEELDV